MQWDDQYETIEDVLNNLRDRLTQQINELHQIMLRDWRAKVRTWTIQTRQLHRYVKNDMRATQLVVNCDGLVTNHPSRLAHALNLFWTRVASWPQGVTNDVWESVEDRFAVFLPHIPSNILVTGSMLKNQAKYMKAGTHGCDGWAVQEIRKLPQSAWDEFVRLYVHVWSHQPPELLVTKRRTPIERKSRPEYRTRVKCDL